MGFSLPKIRREQDAERLWALCRQHGISRRDFLRLMAIGGTAAVLAACTTAENGQTNGQIPETGGTPAAEGEATATGEQPWAKDSAPFIIRGGNLETRLENMRGWITPGELWFVRNNAPASPRIDAEGYRLQVEGDGVANPVEFSLDELRLMPQRSVPTAIECAGNMRNLFDLIMGQTAEGGEWITGGVSNGEWTGVPLSYVLQLAQVNPDAGWVLPQGLDTEAPEGGHQKPITMEKAMDPDTIVALALNGQDIPIDNGYPVRLVVPGWVGSTNVKWLGKLTVSREQPWVRNNTTSYVLIGPDWPAEQYAPAEGAPIHETVIKSALALPWDGELPAGPRVVRGFAWSPTAVVNRVEYSTDGGGTWNEARLTSPAVRYAWRSFEFDWDAPAGEQTIMTRATDEDGNTQPDSQPFNEKGYLFNMVYPHPIRVQ
ncbi:MAG TPA: molybdopterin-dependent oxidoreductase [Anaerolineaceae bacterium]|nr:molybdopterin-dependent oxidoreductase [Anaerolineaceae bacterium]